MTASGRPFSRHWAPTPVLCGYLPASPNLDGTGPGNFTANRPPCRQKGAILQLHGSSSCGIPADLPETGFFHRRNWTSKRHRTWARTGIFGWWGISAQLLQHVARDCGEYIGRPWDGTLLNSCSSHVDIRTAEGLEVEVHHLISLGGWNDVVYLSIYLLGW